MKQHGDGGVTRRRESRRAIVTCSFLLLSWLTGTCSQEASVLDEMDADQSTSMLVDNHKAANDPGPVFGETISLVNNPPEDTTTTSTSASNDQQAEAEDEVAVFSSIYDQDEAPDDMIHPSTLEETSNLLQHDPIHFEPPSISESTDESQSQAANEQPQQHLLDEIHELVNKEQDNTWAALAGNDEMTDASSSAAAAAAAAQHHATTSHLLELHQNPELLDARDIDPVTLADNIQEIDESQTPDSLLADAEGLAKNVETMDVLANDGYEADEIVLDDQLGSELLDPDFAPSPAAAREEASSGIGQATATTSSARNTDTPEAATGGASQISTDSPNQVPYCGVWGTSQRERPIDVSILFKFFQYDILGNKTEYDFGNPHDEAVKITNAAFQIAQEVAVPLSVKPTNEFVDGLDDIHKFFEDVEPPDELDVGAGGSSIQEVLIGQGGRIVLKRLKMGVALIHRSVTAASDQVLERIQDDSGNINLLNKEKLDIVRRWLVATSIKTFHVTRRVVDALMDGNFGGIMDAFGIEDEDLAIDYDPGPMERLKSSSGYTGYTASPSVVQSTAEQNRPTTTKGTDDRSSLKGDSDTDAEMAELLRLIGLSPGPTPTDASAGGATASSSSNKASEAPSTGATSTSSGAVRKPAMDKEMDGLLRQLGI